MVLGIILGLTEITLYFGFSYYFKKFFTRLQEINNISYYWFMITILTFVWEYSFISEYNEVVNYSTILLNNTSHVWTKNYDITYLLPWNFSKIFYAEYGAYADKEYMSLNDDWSKTIESTHAFFCGLFSLFAILLKINNNERSYYITVGISMGAQLMNSILYMVEYYYQTQDSNNINFNTPNFPCGLLYSKRPFMWVNIFWTIMPLYTIIYSLLEKKYIKNI